MNNFFGLLLLVLVLDALTGSVKQNETKSNALKKETKIWIIHRTTEARST